MWWLRSRMKIQERLYISRQSINPWRTLVSMFVSEYVWQQTSRGHVTRLQRPCSPFAFHLLFSGKAVSGTWVPSTVFLFLFDSARVWPIRIYVRWSLFFITRSPLSGASIFHSYPLSQPCLFFFFFFSFSWCCANVSVVSREIKEHPTYLSSKNKKIPDRIDSRVQPVWMLRVMGFCYNQ